jgi:hypothetical protein
MKNFTKAGGNMISTSVSKRSSTGKNITRERVSWAAIAAHIQTPKRLKFLLVRVLKQHQKWSGSTMRVFVRMRPRAIKMRTALSTWMTLVADTIWRKSVRRIVRGTDPE